MKKALISPQEIQSNGNYRVVQISEQEFEVAPPLFWKEIADDASHDIYREYNPKTESFVAVQIDVPPPPPEEKP